MLMLTLKTLVLLFKKSNIALRYPCLTSQFLAMLIMKAVSFITIILLLVVGLEAHVDKGEGEKKTEVAELEDIMSKDELLQGMEKVDREIAQVKQQINNLKKMQVSV